MKLGRSHLWRALRIKQNTIPSTVAKAENFVFKVIQINIALKKNCFTGVADGSGVNFKRALNKTVIKLGSATPCH